MNDLTADETPRPSTAAPASESPVGGADELRGIEKALTSLADEHKRAAERHLIRAALGLIIGFFTALLLPVAFTLIDAYVERQLSDFRSEGTASQLRIDNDVATQFAKVSQQRARYQQDKQDILRSAYDTRFGSVIFRDYPYIEEERPITLGFRGQQASNCPGIEGNVSLWDLPVSGHYAGLIGTGADTRRFHGKPALVYMGKAERSCAAVALEIPGPGSDDDPGYRFDGEHLSLTPGARGLAIPVLAKTSEASEALAGVLVCNLEAETAPASDNGSGENAGESGGGNAGESSGGNAGGGAAPEPGGAPCALIETPENLRKAEVSRIVMNEIGTGFGLLAALRSGGSTLLSLTIEPDGTDGDRGLAGLQLRSQALALDSGVNQIMVRDRDAFVLGSAYNGPVPILRLRASQDFVSPPAIEDAGSIFVGESSGRISALDQWGGRTVALVSRQEQDIALAISGSNRLIPLYAVADAEGSGQFSELHIRPGDGNKTFLLMQRGRGFQEPVLIGRQAPRSYAADIDKVFRLFESTDPLSALPDTITIDVLAAQQPWESRNVLVPASDRSIVERARAIKPVVDAFDAAETSFHAIQKDLTDSRSSLAEAQRSLKDTESDIAFWTTIAARVVIIALIFYFVQLEMSLNRYNSRLSGHYRARALAVNYLLGTGRDVRDIGFEDLFAAILAIDSKEISGKEPPGPPTDKLIAFLQNALKSREKPE